MQQLITNYYTITPKSIALKVYKGLYNYVKNKMFSENTTSHNYKQKLITDYYTYLPKKVKTSNNLDQSLITRFYHKN
jgi:hypothetical protein